MAGAPDQQAGQEAFADQIDFIADNGAWRILENPVTGPAEEDGFGLLDASAGGSGVRDTGYGFFEPLEQPEAAAPAVASDENDGYGFFEPLPATDVAEAKPVLAEEGDGYGFFEPVLRHRRLRLWPKRVTDLASSNPCLRFLNPS